MLSNPKELQTDCTTNTACSGNLHLVAQWKAVTADKWENGSLTSKEKTLPRISYSRFAAELLGLDLVSQKNNKHTAV